MTSSPDGAAYVWDVATGQRELLLVGCDRSDQRCRLQPRRQRDRDGLGDRLARIYYSQDGRLLAPLAGHRKRRDERRASTRADGRSSPARATAPRGSGTQLPQGALTPIDQRPGPVETFFAGSRPVTVAGRTARVLTPTGRVIRTVTLPGRIIAAATEGGAIAVADDRGYVVTVPPKGSRESGRFPESPRSRSPARRC